MPLPCPRDILNLEDQGAALLTDRLSKVMAGPDLFKGPVLRAMASRFNVWKWSTNNTLMHEFILKGNLKEIPEASPEAVELVIKRATIGMRETAMDIRKIYAEHMGVGQESFGRDFRAWVAGHRNKETYDEFIDKVSKAMRRGDVDPESATVTAAARKLRGQIEKSVNNLKAAGFLPEELDVKFASSWLARKYNLNRIQSGFKNSRGETFGERLERHFREENPGMDSADVRELARKTEDNIRGLGDEQLEANALVGHVMKGGDGKSFLKERVLTLDDTELEPWLSGDALNITYGFVNQAESLVAITRKFEELSALSGQEIKKVSDLTKMLRDEADALVRQTDDPFTKSKIAEEAKKAQQEIIDQWDMVAGRFGVNNYPALQKLRKLNTVAMLGGIALSSIPDLMMTVFKNGFGSVWKNGIPKTLKQIHAKSLTRKQTQNMVGVYESHMNSILKAQTDPSFNARGISNTPIDRAIDTISDFFTSVTGINVWNRWVSSMGAELHAASLMDDMAELASTGTLSKIKKARWARNGIGEDQYHILRRNLRHVDDVDGATHVNFRDWDNEAQELLSNSILRDQTVLQPGRGDIPKMFQEDDVMRSIFQFKSFVATAHNRIFVAGAQRARLQGAGGMVGNEAQGIMGLISMGAMVYTLKMKIDGKEPDFSVDNLLREGIARSGVGGLMFEASSFIPGIRSSSRFAGVNAQGFLGGPTLTQAARLVELSHGVADGDFSDEDAQKALRFIPFNNLFYLRGLYQGLGD